MAIKAGYQNQWKDWRYGQDGPGGGSVPANVMATGAIAPFDPLNVRRDIESPMVAARTSIPVGRRPGVAAFTPGPSTTPTMAGAFDGAVLGADAAGRPIRAYNMPFAQSVPEARQAMGAFKRAASILRRQNLFNLAPPLIGGPLASLARGEAIVLKWPNGIQFTAAL